MSLMPLLVTTLLLLAASWYWLPFPWATLLLFAQRSSAGLQSKHRTVDGRTFHYLEGGRSLDGVAIVMLHGFGANADHWVPMARSLRRRFRVLAPDLPGFGRSSAAMTDGFELPLQAERVHAFLRAKGLRRYHLVGNSMGGNICGLLAHDFPDEVASLTLLEPQGIESRIPTAVDLQIRNGLVPLVPTTAEDFDHLVELAFVKRPFIPRAVYLYLRSEALASATLHHVVWRGLWSPEYPYLLEKQLPGIHAPTLVVWGDSDRFLHHTAIEKLERDLTDVRVVRMKACGHTPMLERPAEVANHFESFVEQLARDMTIRGHAESNDTPEK
jgi:pimeloyl-ACP methyl ester carboxylesterase